MKRILALSMLLTACSVKQPLLRTGELPNEPVIAYWVGEDGVITAMSVIRTTHAGIIPYSITYKPVPFIVLDPPTFWAPIDQSFIDGGF